MAFPGGSDGKESACNAGHLGLIPGSGKFPWRREWLPSPVLLPGEFHGQRSLAGYTVHGVAKTQTQLKQLSTVTKVRMNDLLSVFSFVHKLHNTVHFRRLFIVFCISLKSIYKGYSER